MTSTPGLKALQAAGISVSLHPYDYDRTAEAVGRAAAEALGLDPGLTLKTLMVELDGYRSARVKLKLLKDRRVRKSVRLRKSR